MMALQLSIAAQDKPEQKPEKTGKPGIGKPGKPPGDRPPGGKPGKPGKPGEKPPGGKKPDDNPASNAASSSKQ